MAEMRVTNELMSGEGEEKLHDVCNIVFCVQECWSAEIWEESKRAHSVGVRYSTRAEQLASIPV